MWLCCHLPTFANCFLAVFGEKSRIFVAKIVKEGEECCDEV